MKLPWALAEVTTWQQASADATIDTFLRAMVVAGENRRCEDMRLQVMFGIPTYREPVDG